MHDSKVNRRGPGSTCGGQKSWIGLVKRARVLLTSEESGEGG